MKSKFSILFLFFLLFFLNIPAIPAAADPFILVLDAGHGGKDPGTVGKKAKEKNINLAVTLLTGKYISEKHPDVKVVYTRTKDVFIGLNERANIANKSHANLFISIHTNASPHSSAVRGTEIYAFGVSRTAENLEVAKRENAVIYLEDNYQEKYEGFDPKSSESYIIFEFMQNKFVEQSLDFASLVCNEMKKCAQWRDRGVKQAEYLVLRKSTMPRILVELDFITNSVAEALLASDAGQKKYAKAICDAFGKYKADYDRKNNARRTTTPFQPSKETSNAKPATAAKDKSTPGKRIYKVQIFALPQKLPDNSPHLKGYKASYYVENKMYKYTYGESHDPEEISRIRKSLLKDFKDAFIVAFEEGVKVPL